ncbi:MAG: hypothetical protein HZA52_12675 [Planctomycetes bacterium]|nr:hypothetical protein [Planctomycetota bacterium]
MQTLEQIRVLSEDRFLMMYESLSTHGFGPLDAEVAKLMKFRPQAIRKLPMAMRAKKAKALLLAQKNAELAYEFLGTYLLKDHKDLVTGFLDATGVAHENGMIDDTPGNLPDADKVAAAVKELDGKFAKDDVTAYLAIAAQQWSEVKSIEPLWRSRLA